jgi:hypothetical protein
MEAKMKRMILTLVKGMGAGLSLTLLAGCAVDSYDGHGRGYYGGGSDNGYYEPDYYPYANGPTYVPNGGRSGYQRDGDHRDTDRGDRRDHGDNRGDNRGDNHQGNRDQGNRDQANANTGNVNKGTKSSGTRNGGGGNNSGGNNGAGNWQGGSSNGGGQQSAPSSSGPSGHFGHPGTSNNPL